MKDEITIKLVTRLTRELKDPVKRPSSRYEIRDTALPGFMLRVEPSGRMSYCMVYAHGKRFTIGSTDSMDANQARTKAKEIDAAHDKAKNGEDIDPIEKKQREHADRERSAAKAKAENYLHFLQNVYEPHLKVTLRNGADNAENVKETMDCLKNRFAELHNKGLGELTPLMIDKWTQKRSEEVKPTTIRRQLNDLRACLNYAVKRGYLDVSPFEKMEAYEATEEARVRYLSPDEETRLRKALDERESDIRAARQTANVWRTKRGYEQYTDLGATAFVDHLKPAVLLSLNTGVRKGELLKLRWSSIDFEQRILTVEAGTAKSSKPRRIKLNAEALWVLRAWKEQPGIKSIYVFSGSDGQPFDSVRTSWIGVLERAEIVDFHWHDLRHTFASKLVIAGVDLNKVRELLGHSDYKMTLRYAHLAPEHMQDAVDKLVPASAAV
jgi:integrase